jgi:hypothetical protein
LLVVAEDAPELSDVPPAVDPAVVEPADVVDVEAALEPVAATLDVLMVDPVVEIPPVELLFGDVEQATPLRASPSQRASFTNPPSRRSSYPSPTSVAR